MWRVWAASLSFFGPILTFMMKTWRDTRERHRVKFLLMMSKAMLFAFLTFMPHARVQVLAWDSRSLAIGLENINLCSPSKTCAQCLRYKPTNNRKKNFVSIFNVIGLIVISQHSFCVSSRVFVVFEDKWNLNMVYQVLN